MGAICTWISQQVAGQKIAITTAFMMNSTVAERNLETFIEFWFDPKERDYRTEGWLLCHFNDSLGGLPTPLFVCTAYVLFAVKIGPSFMENRKPYEISTLINLYNLFQVVANVLLVYGYYTNGWSTYYNWLCQGLDPDPNPGSPGYNMAIVALGAYLIRYVDFLDTLFFILRKKFGNVSTLQVYHHFSMPLYAWIQMTWTPGGHHTLGGIFNCCVHIIMYSYYFLAAMGPQYRKYLWWKRYLTRLQLIQFVFIMTRSLTVVYGVEGCTYPWQISLVSALYMVTMMVFFSHFYVNEYIFKKKEKKGLEKKAE